MKNILDFLKIIDRYIIYLEERNIVFDSNGFPIFNKKMFLDVEPEMIIPFSHRNNRRVLDKSKTVICTYESDKRIYPRFKKIFDELDIYKEYLGVIGTDITVTDDMDPEWQEIILLANQLYMAILAVNGIKIILNTRLGNNNNLKLFINYPQNIMCASSFLGCKKADIYDYSYISKIMSFLPSKLLIYGKKDKNATSKLDIMGINYKYYSDFHTICKEGC